MFFVSSRHVHNSVPITWRNEMYYCYFKENYLDAEMKKIAYIDCAMVEHAG